MSTSRETLSALIRSRDFLHESPIRSISLEEAAREACLSQYHYHRLFTQVFQETPHEVLTRVRLDRAKELLLFGSQSIGEICFEVGFASIGTFSSRFKREFGLTPVEFRRQTRRCFALGHLWSHRFIPNCFLRTHAQMSKIEEAS